MKFVVHALSLFLFISVLVFAQNAPGSDTKKQLLELVMQHHVHGFVYCPGKRVDIAEIILRSSKSLSAPIPHAHADKNGYFDFGHVPVGRYELVVENKCSATTNSVNNFEVAVQPGTTTWFKDCLPEEVIIQLRKRSSPEISYRSTKSANCG